ncbi:hypothetical protein [Marinirhabdus gelatinilytica]|uniref:Lipocalin-like protein n=1 Tax=Marinirhabdus gelatinilytica TaxID=1703343 RepID=A0A370Q695_9FLAO|nr:hypothetical protein [Marinirhabdus gelatinilytica]RDK83839.1 hypothetical protein C8D94_10652 [Marinirhabdus gelatinilytica]
MKYLLTAFIFLALLSCKKDDDPLNNDNILVNTTWEGERVEDGIYTFTSNTEYTFKDPGEPFVDGNYSFDGRQGVLMEETGFTANFGVSGTIMTVTDTINTNPRTYFKIQ